MDQPVHGQKGLRPTMSLAQARRRLREHYQRLAILEAEAIDHGDDIVLLAIRTTPGGSTQDVVRRLQLMDRVREVRDIIDSLTSEESAFIRLRYQQEQPLREVARKLHRAVGAMPELERRVLATFIRACNRSTVS